MVAQDGKLKDQQISEREENINVWIHPMDVVTLHTPRSKNVWTKF